MRFSHSISIPGIWSTLLVTSLLATPSFGFVPLQKPFFAKGIFLAADDSPEAAQPLPLTAYDLKRLATLKKSSTTMPILISDTLLPRQQVVYQSSDAKFRRLLDYCLSHDQSLGMIGINPMTGRPLTRGVTLQVHDSKIAASGRSLALDACGQARIQVIGDPYLDDSGSFYLAQVQVVDERHEPLSEDQQQVVDQLSATLPDKIEEWMAAVLDSQPADAELLQSSLDQLGPMPDSPTDRALWTAALLNPVAEPQQWCVEIRPAMLAAASDYDRTILACQAVQSSIDHVTGKRRMF